MFMVSICFEAKDGSKVLFREPRPGDAPQMMAFINSVIAEKLSGIVFDKKVTLKTENTWLAGVLRGIKRRERVMLLVESNGEILGNCDVSRRTMKHSHRAVIGIALVKKTRGMGIGEAVMRATIDLAGKRMKGLEFIDLSTFEYNKRAQKLYKKLGFAKVGEIPDAVREGDRYFSEHLMALDLKNWERR